LAAVANSVVWMHSVYEQLVHLTFTDVKFALELLIIFYVIITSGTAKSYYFCSGVIGVVIPVLLVS
jgi:hypothetical protein